jgi:undecaprenyl diphosphate synthase
MALRRSDLTIRESAPEESNLLAKLDMSRLPTHVAIIMDGNGRWAKLRNRPRAAGHREGGEAVRRTVETAAKLGLDCLTLYAFSTENWKRSRFEIRALMDLLTEYLRRELPSLRQNNIQFRMIGSPEGLNISVLEQVRKAEISTFQNTGMRLNVALNYGSRGEIVHAARSLAQSVLAGDLSVDQIDDNAVASRLYTSSLPDPDLLIRTSGELRLSNFLLWQIAYSEIYVTDAFWPDFDENELIRAILAYQKRERRFGGLATPQCSENAPGDAVAVSPDGRLPAYSRPQ